MAVLRLLQRRGKASIREMVRILGVTTTAVREQTIRLQEQGLIYAMRESGGPGRPWAVYTLTEKGWGIFPKNYPRLAGAMMGGILSAPAGIREELLGHVAEGLAEAYGELDAPSTGTSPGHLARCLEAEGVAIKLRSVPEGTVLEELNCPYHELSEGHPELCEVERRAFSKALVAPVTLVQNRWEGAGTCRFLIEKSHGEGKKAV